jgi:hypothetical protein
MNESLVINQKVVAGSYVERARKALLGSLLERNYGEMILAQLQTNLSPEQQLFIMELLVDQLEVELHSEELLGRR